jgi:hypothetical protein
VQMSYGGGQILDPTQRPADTSAHSRSNAPVDA